MAADVALLDDLAAGGLPTLRLYRWSAPAVSLGRFQRDQVVDRAACARHGVEVVRRPSGGRALLHGGDLTYAVAMPRPSGPAGSIDAVYGLVAAALVAGLARLGVAASVGRGDGATGPACFAGQQGADLRVGERKVCGAAQLQRAGAVLQHGALLLQRLRFDETDLLRGAGAREGLHAATVTLAELGAPTDARAVAAALVAGFAERLDVCFTSTPPRSRSQPVTRPQVEVE